MNNQTRSKPKYILIGILGILFIGLIVPIFSLEALSMSRPKAYDARVMADMSQIRAAAEMIFSEEGNYINVNCDYGDIKILCEDIERTVDNKPTIYTSQENYCAYTKLRSEETAYFCIDSIGAGIKTYINPGGLNYCDGTTFICPKEKGTPPPKKLTPTNILIRVGLVGGGIIMLGVIIFSWVHAFKSRKKEIIREENWALIKEEIKSKKVFYVLLVLLELSLISPILQFTVFEGKMYAVPGLSIGLSYLIGTIAAVGVFFTSLALLIEKIKRGKPQIVCWESYTAALCLGVFWFGFIINLTMPIFGFGVFYIIFTPPFILGIGFSINSLIHRGKLNKILGIIILLIFLFPVLLIPISWVLK